ncbi:MAG TPA: glycoside hydrolase family 3 C-terminal domain-containing protein [Pseudomonadales bacterium]|nr:glycoside hydrolase family 3 C-terminal domain-containing protein [Pseudomonadales bacterium]
MTKKVLAFDHHQIHAGNKGLGIDHESVARKVEQLVDSMTLAQLFNEIRGLQQAPIEGLYHAGGNESLGIPVYKMVDGPRGARAGNATAFPVALARAATFDVELERRVGLAIGKEVAAKGGNVLLAPTINLLRHPGWGRAQETYSEDTFHTGAMGAAFISGAQNYVLTSPKHFAMNNVEFTRFDMSANCSPRVLHEIYLRHFRRCVVEAAAASVMSAYNKLNGIYCGEHPELLTTILREKWGFTGFVESDWFLGTRSTAPALSAGLDIEMPAGYRFSDEKLIEAIQSGEMSEGVIARAAGRAIYQKLAWKLDELEKPPAFVVESPEHLAVAREAAEKSMVLLKNAGALLPLPDSHRLAIVGDLADAINLGDRGSSFVTSTEVVTPLAGLKARFGDDNVAWFRSDDDFSALKDFDVTVIVAGLTYKEEGEYIPTMQQEAEGSDLARGGDRVSLALPDHQRELIRRAAAAANKVVVALQGTAVQVGDWIESVDAILMTWYPGCQGGHALAAILTGDACPSGRLPVTIPKSADQLVPWDVEALEVEHDLLQGYRYVDYHGHEPEFPFGFGLSYTEFDLEGLYVQRFDNGFEVSVDVTNTGKVAGATIVQLYVGYSNSSVLRPVRELKGFGRVELSPGEQATLVIELEDDDLTYFDEAEDDFVLEAADYHFDIGFSSRDLSLSQSWRLSPDGFEPI